MSRIEDLIAEQCPDGVDFLSLGQVAHIKNGRDYKHLSEGNVPVYGSGGIMRYVDTAAANGPSVLIPRKGSLGNLFYVEGPFWVVDTIFRTEIDSSLIEPKFLYYKLLTMGLGEMNQAGGVPSQTQSGLNRLKIPVPPLEVQREIVRILDGFTSLEAELEAELEARRAQYAYYRDQLLTFPEADSLLSLSARRIRWMKMSDIAEISRGRVISKDYLARHSGSYPVYSSQTQNHGVFGYIDNYDYDIESITWTTDGANAGSVFHHRGEKFSITNVCGLLRVKEPQVVSTRYLFHQLSKVAKHYVSSGMGNPKLMAGPMGNIRIPVIDINEQVCIVGILDKFDALVNDLTSGLPAELEARRQQYEYYRDKLLTFKELV